MKYNSHIQQKYKNEMEIFDKHQKAKAQGLPSELPAGINEKRRPRMMQVKKPILQCMCSQSHCMMENSDVGSSCPIRCIECKVSGKRFPFSQIAPRRCTCPVCSCECNKAYYVDQIPKLLLMTRKFTLDDEPVEKMAAKGNEPASSLGWLSKCVSSGVEAGIEAISSVEKTGREPWNKISPAVKSETMARTNAAVYSHMAEAMSQEAKFMNYQQVQHLRSLLPTPTTNVTLPSGDVLNTAALTKSANQHSRNNGLGVVQSSSYQPGMMNNQDFDLSNPRQPYLRAVNTWQTSESGEDTKVGSSFLNLGHRSSSYNCPITIEDDKDNQANTNEPHTKKAKTMHVNPSDSVENTEKGEEVRKDEAAAKMYHRVHVRARKAVDDAVNAVMSGNRSEEAMNEVKKKRAFVEKLKERKNEKNDHLEDIICVTNNGEDLVGYDEILSQDVMEKMTVYHGFF